MQAGTALRNLIRDNPVVRREARLRFWRAWPLWHKAAVVAAATGCVSLVLFCSRGLLGGADTEQRRFLTVTYGSVLAAAAAIMGARSVAGEREVRTWEQVLITRLRPLHLIVGKIVGAMSHVALGLVVTAPGLWIVMMYFDPVIFTQRPDLWRVVFAPAGLSGYFGGASDDAGLVWLFTAGMLWTAQGATIGVFASLRYRSTITSAIVALIMLWVAMSFDWLFLFAGGYRFAGDPSSLSAVAAALVSGAVAWGWPLVTVVVMTALAAYEFREFDRWLQAALRQAQDRPRGRVGRPEPSRGAAGTAAGR